MEALNYTTAQIIVGVFLLITLIVGLWAGKNVKAMKDYALANKEFGATILTITFLATLIDGWDVQTLPERIFSIGLVEFVSRPGMVLGFFFFGWLVAPKLFRFKGCLTLGEIGELLFGSSARVATGFFGVLASILWISMQIMLLGPITSTFLGIEASYGIIIGGLIMVLYASVGGVRAVTMTDIIQFIALVVFIILMVGGIIYHVGGIHAIWARVATSHPEKLVIVEHPRFTLKSLHFTGNIFVVTTLFLPAYMQRLLMGKNTKEIRKMLIGSATIYGFVLGAVILIGLGGLALFPQVSPDQLVVHLSQALFPKSIQTVFPIGFIAIVMSTIDSQLSSSGLVLSHDVIKPLCDRFNIEINEIRIVKWVTFIVGAFSILLALVLGSEGIMDTVLVLADYSTFVISIIAVPMCIGIMGLITDRKSFIAGVSVAATMLVTMRALSLDGITSELIYIGSVIGNAVTFLITHYINNSGFKYSEVIDMGPGNPPLVKARTWSPSLYYFTLWAEKNIPSPQSIIAFSKRKIDSYGYFRKPLSGYFLLTFLFWSAMLITQTITVSPLGLLMRIVGLVFLLTLFLDKSFDPKVKRFFPVFWHATLMYCLPFMLTLVYLWEGGGTFLYVEFIVGMVMLMMLVDRTSFWILKFGGVLLGCGVYYIAKGENPFILSTKSVSLLSGYGAAMVMIRSGLQPMIKKYRSIKRESEYRKDMEEIMYSGVSWGEKYRRKELGRIQDIIPYMEEILEDKQVNTEREHVFVVTLDSGMKIINIKMLHLGTKDQTIFVSKDVLNEAVMRDASGIILVHNHPNGDPRPSKEDERSTTDLLHACHYVGLILMDHLIVTKGGKYFSFRVSGHIGKVEEELEELKQIKEQLDRKIEKTENQIEEFMEMIKNKKEEKKTKKEIKKKEEKSAEDCVDKDSSTINAVENSVSSRK